MSFISLVNNYMKTPYIIDFKSETSSTNDDVLACADAHDEFYVIAAGTQTNGKGRKTRSFYSPQGAGIYFSILLKPDIPPEKSVFITTAAAVAVCDAVSSLSNKKPRIKWVNDVLTDDGKKLCGILTEGAIEDGHLKYAVLGIGVNMFPPQGGYPDDLKSIVASVFDYICDDEKARFMAAVLDNFYYYYKNGGYQQRYKDLCCVLGKQITVINGDSLRSAKALDIDKDCRLIVKYDDGTTAALSSGEISIKL